MRTIAYAEVSLESCTFNPLLVELDDFQCDHWHLGDEIPQFAAGVNHLGGFLAAVGDYPEPIELIPLLQARARPGGRVSAAALERIVDELTGRLRAAPPLDGLLLSLHGACVGENVDDVEGHVLTAVRAVIGEAVPIAVPLDHHANLTEAMVRLATIMVGDQSQPHSPFRTGRLAGQQLLRLIESKVEPAVAWHKIPLITPQDRYLTDSYPMKEWFDLARRIEQDPAVISASTFPMQPWLDVDQAGWASLVYTDGDASRAAEHSATLAKAAWDLRAEFWLSQRVPLAEAAAASRGPGLALLSDTGDAIHAGAPGDSTAVLRAILDQDIGGDAYLFIIDPDAVDHAHAVGIGGAFEGHVGGWSGALSASSTAVSGTVVGLSHGVHVRLSKHGFSRLGRIALVALGSVKLVLCRAPAIAMLYPVLYTHLGLDIADAKAVMLKTGSNFNFYDPWHPRVIRLDSPGPTQSELRDLPWSHAPRPIYPLDDLPEWDPPLAV